MIQLPIGTGDFEREISVNVDGKEGTLRIIREISRDYGEKRNECGAFMYALLLDSARLKAYSSTVELPPRSLVRISPDAKYSIEPEEREQPSKMRKGDISFNPIRAVTFIPPMLEEPTKADFQKVWVYRPDWRTRDWYCGYYNDGEELGISPIEIAHGYVGNDYLADSKRNTPHYHARILEGWIPLYGLIEGVFSTVSGAQLSGNSFMPLAKEGESLSELVSYPEESGKIVEISVERMTATVPGEAHMHRLVKGSGIWETITFKYPGLSREESEKDKIEYRFKD